MSTTDARRAAANLARYTELDVDACARELYDGSFFDVKVAVDRESGETRLRFDFVSTISETLRHLLSTVGDVPLVLDVGDGGEEVWEECVRPQLAAALRRLAGDDPGLEVRVEPAQPGQGEVLHGLAFIGLRGWKGAPEPEDDRAA
ncbi:MAG TPA: hypothetical protein VGC45_11210 [Gryllotalpicola sp.]